MTLEPSDTDPTTPSQSALLTGALEATEDGLIVFDGEGTVRYCNERLSEILPPVRELLRGCSAGEAAEAARSIFEDDERFLNLVKREFEEPALETSEEFRLTDGRVIHRYTRPIRTDGRVSGRVHAVRDVTDFRTHERRLEQAQRLAGIGSWEWVVSENEVYWSDELYETFGLEPDAFEATYEAFLERVHPDDREHVHKTVQETLESGDSYEMSLRVARPDGRVRHTRVFGEGVQVDGETVLIRGIVQDVTEQEQARRERDRAERRYRTLFEMSPLALAVSVPSGRIVDVNRHFEQLLGRSSSAIRGRNAQELDIWVDLEDRAEVLRRLDRDEQVQDFETRLRTASGELLEVEMTVDGLELGDEMVLAWAIRDVTDRNRYRRELERKALYDDLTGLPNRTLLYDRLNQATKIADRRRDDLAVLFVDLDDFKAVNESYGHTVGDRVLAEAASRMDATLRESDVLGRIGGDEFLAVLPSTGQTGANRAARRLMDALSAAPFELPDTSAYLTASVGAALRSEDLADPSSLVRAADAAMMRAKASSEEGASFEIYGPEDELGAFRLQRQSRLRQAIEQNELVLYFQPVVDLEEGGRIVGAEALVRWRHPERGLLPPGEFIPFAEETGMVADVDRWVLRTAVRRAGTWHASSILPTDLQGPFYLAVNVSAPLYQSPGFADLVTGTLEETDVDPSALQLEITERLSVSKSGAWGQLRGAGVRLAVDDFGTGYSSLRYLRQLEADVLKVDQYFTQDLTEDANRTSVIVKAVHSIARQMGMDVIAEGVETEEQRDHLVSLGYRYLQGFLFSRPMPAEELTEQLV